MSLTELTVENLRCLERVELGLHPGHNLIWGGNGSGKTSLLEAIFLLGRGRSFRTRNSERLIRHGQERLIVFGRTAGVPSQALGIQVSRQDGTIARIGGTSAGSLAELSQAFPVQVIDPGVHKLVEEGGHRRRRWMDWAVFHVEPGFVDLWVRYTRALKQRNAALRQQPAQAAAWDPELARVGELIAESRRDLMERLQPHWREAVAALCGLEVELHYVRGWVQDVPLTQALRDARSRDQAKGLTHPGPHRADVLVRLNGRPAREVLSRGQQKLVAVAMTLAQLYLLRELTGAAPTLLLDDPAAELDGTHLLKFIDQVMRLQSQLVLTSLQPESQLFGTPDRVFHVEQGGVRTVYNAAS
jgi:DNA replication and repair protein RecF